EHQDEFCAEVLHRVFDASQFVASKLVVAAMLTLHEIAGNANDEELAKPLVEDDLRRDPRVGAHDDGGIGVLTGCQLLPNVRAAIPHQVAEASSGVKLIPLQQEGEGIVGADRFLLCRIGGQRRGGDGEGNKGSQKKAFSSLHISPPISLYVRYRARSLARWRSRCHPRAGRASVTGPWARPRRSARDRRGGSPRRCPCSRGGARCRACARP